MTRQMPGHSLLACKQWPSHSKWQIWACDGYVTGSGMVPVGGGMGGMQGHGGMGSPSMGGSMGTGMPGIPGGMPGIPSTTGQGVH